MQFVPPKGKIKIKYWNTTLEQIKDIQINLRTPSDYDEFTGLVDLTKQTKYSNSEFSGVYKIIIAQSTFSGGVFTQNLTGIREKMQPQANGKLARSKYSQKSIERGALLVDDFGDPNPGKPSADYSDFASSGSVTQTVQGSDYVDDSAFAGDKRFSEEITQDYSILEMILLHLKQVIQAVLMIFLVKENN